MDFARFKPRTLALLALGGLVVAALFSGCAAPSHSERAAYGTIQVTVLSVAGAPVKGAEVSVSTVGQLPVSFSDAGPYRTDALGHANILVQLTGQPVLLVLSTPSGSATVVVPGSFSVLPVTIVEGTTNRVVNVAVGSTTIVAVRGVTVTGITSSAPGVVAVGFTGDSITFTGVSAGSADVTVTTSGGPFTFTVHVLNPITLAGGGFSVTSTAPVTTVTVPSGTTPLTLSVQTPGVTITDVTSSNPNVASVTFTPQSLTLAPGTLNGASVVTVTMSDGTIFTFDAIQTASTHNQGGGSGS